LGLYGELHQVFALQFSDLTVIVGFLYLLNIRAGGLVRYFLYKETPLVGACSWLKILSIEALIDAILKRTIQLTYFNKSVDFLSPMARGRECYFYAESYHFESCAMQRGIGEYACVAVGKGWSRAIR
jgi:hypothetical protein